MKNLNLPKILLVLCAAVILLMVFVGDEDNGQGDNGQDDNSHIFVYDDTCYACGGSGWCSNCSGDQRCDSCYDTGFAPGTTCKKCYGSGECYSDFCTLGRSYDALNKRYTSCSLCNGKNICSRCDGTRLDDCPNCYGGSCSNCRGARGHCKVCEGDGRMD